MPFATVSLYVPPDGASLAELSGFPTDIRRLRSKARCVKPDVINAET